MSDYGSLVPSGGAASQIRMPFTPTVVPATLGDWTIAYTTQTGLLIVDGALAWLEVNLAFTPTFTTAAGTLRFGTLPMPAANIIAALQVQTISSNIAYPGTGTSMTARLFADLTAVALFGVKSAANPTALTAAALTSGAAHSIAFSGTIRVT